MDKELYLIHLDDYLDHIDGKLDMYDLLLELVRSLRSDLNAGEFSQAMRTLCSYEQKAHEMYEDWCIPDEYAKSGDPDDLSQLMEDELLPADDGEDYGEDDMPPLLSIQLGRVSDLMHRSADIVRDICQQLAEVELEAIDEALAEYEKPGNDCAV